MSRLHLRTEEEEKFRINRAFYRCAERAADIMTINNGPSVAAVEADQDDKGNISFYFYESLKDAEKRENALSAEDLLGKKGDFSDIVTEEEAGKVAELFGKLSAGLVYGYSQYTPYMLENKTEALIAVTKIKNEIDAFIHSEDLPFASSISKSLVKGKWEADKGNISSFTQPIFNSSLFYFSFTYKLK